MHKKQQDRKKRKNFTPELFERYFRRNEGTTDHATIPTVTLAGDFSGSFDLWASDITTQQTIVSGDDGSDSTYLVVDIQGGSVRFWSRIAGVVSQIVTVPANSAAEMKCVFSVAGTIATLTVNGVSASGVFGASYQRLSRLYTRNGAVSLSGILANLKIWDNGTLIRDYPLDDNSDDLRELANGQNGTVINGNASDWGLFQQQVTGEWLGQELVVNGGFDTDSDWTKNAGVLISSGMAEFSSVANNGLLQTSVLKNAGTYRVAIDVESIASGEFRAWAGAAEGVTSHDGVAVTGVSVITLTPDNSLNGNIHFSGSSAVTGSIDNVSVKEVLNVA